MEVSTEAKRIMVVALGKLYSSRTQRGGLRLHRSLLLTLVMKSARDMYHAAQVAAETLGTDCEPQDVVVETSVEPKDAHMDHQDPASHAAGQPRTLTSDEVAGSPTVLRHEVHTGADNKENVVPTGPAQHSRKRRGKVAVEPDFLPCKKAKLEQGNSSQHLMVNSVLVDYVNCSSELGAAPVPLHRAIAAC